MLFRQRANSQILEYILPNFSEVELKKILTGSDLNYSPRFKELISKESFLKYLINILNTSTRFPSDLQMLVYYLSHSAGIKSILTEASYENIFGLLWQIAIEIKYEYSESNCLLFKKGDIGEKFYLIIKGKVAVLVVEEKSLYLSMEEYMAYLINLRKYGEHELLQNCFSKNYGLFKFDDDFDHWIKNINSTTKLVIKHQFSLRLLNLIENALSYLQIGNAEQKLTYNEYCSRLAFEVFEDETVERRKGTVYEYKNVVVLKEGDKFGEASMLKDVKQR